MFVYLIGHGDGAVSAQPLQTDMNYPPHPSLRAAQWRGNIQSPTLLNSHSPRDRMTPTLLGESSIRIKRHLRETIVFFTRSTDERTQRIVGDAVHNIRPATVLMPREDTLHLVALLKKCTNRRRILHQMRRIRAVIQPLMTENDHVPLRGGQFTGEPRHLIRRNICVRPRIRPRVMSHLRVETRIEHDERHAVLHERVVVPIRTPTQRDMLRPTIRPLRIGVAVLPTNEKVATVRRREVDDVASGRFDRNTPVFIALPVRRSDNTRLDDSLSTRSPHHATTPLHNLIRRHASNVQTNIQPMGKNDIPPLHRRHKRRVLRLKFIIHFETGPRMRIGDTTDSRTRELHPRLPGQIDAGNRDERLSRSIDDGFRYPLRPTRRHIDLEVVED